MSEEKDMQDTTPEDEGPVPVTEFDMVRTSAPAFRQPTGGALTPHHLLAAMVEQSPTPETLEKMIGLAERWDAVQAKKAYTAAMAQFKKDCPPVLEKSKTAQFDSKRGNVKYTWTPLEDILATVTPHLSANGLSIAHEFSQGGRAVQVTATVSHALGHSEQVTLGAGISDNSLLNQAQQVAVTVTQLRRHTTLAILGLATADLSDEETAGAMAAQEARASRVSKRVPKEELDRFRLLLSQVGPALAKKWQPYYEKARRGSHIDLAPGFEELETSLEPPAPKGGAK
jgi:hypothetical protein